MPDETAPPLNDEQALIDFVSQREVFCPVCKYNLRGLTRPSCPECGNALKLTVGAESQVNKAWLVMLVALLVPSGIGVVGIVGFLAALQYATLADIFSPRDAEEAMALLSILYAITCIPMSAVAVWVRRRFIRFPAGIQITAAAAPAVIDVVIFGFFLSLL